MNQYRACFAGCVDLTWSSLLMVERRNKLFPNTSHIPAIPMPERSAQSLPLKKHVIAWRRTPICHGDGFSISALLCERPQRCENCTPLLHSATYGLQVSVRALAMPVQKVSEPVERVVQGLQAGDLKVNLEWEPLEPASLRSGNELWHRGK